MVEGRSGLSDFKGPPRNGFIQGVRLTPLSSRSKGPTRGRNADEIFGLDICRALAWIVPNREGLMAGYWYQFNNGDLLCSAVHPSAVDCQPAASRQGRIVYQVFSSRERFRLLHLHRRRGNPSIDLDQCA